MELDAPTSLTHWKNDCYMKSNTKRTLESTYNKHNTIGMKLVKVAGKDSHKKEENCRNWFKMSLYLNWIWLQKALAENFKRDIKVE